METSVPSTQFYCEAKTVLKKTKSIKKKNPWPYNRKMDRMSRDSSHAKMKIAIKCKKRYLILLIIRENKL